MKVSDVTLSVWITKIQILENMLRAILGGDSAPRFCIKQTDIEMDCKDLQMWKEFKLNLPQIDVCYCTYSDRLQ